MSVMCSFKWFVNASSFWRRAVTLDAMAVSVAVGTWALCLAFSMRARVRLVIAVHRSSLGGRGAGCGMRVGAGESVGVEVVGRASRVEKTVAMVVWSEDVSMGREPAARMVSGGGWMCDWKTGFDQIWSSLVAVVREEVL